MSAIIKPTWNIKPPLGFSVNHGHPLSVGLVSAWLLNERAGHKVFDLEHPGNQVTSWSGPTWSNSTFTTAIRHAGSGNITGSPIRTSIASGPFTIFILTTPTSGGGTFFSVGTSLSTDKALHLRVTGSTSLLFGLLNDDLGVTVANLVNRRSSFTFTLDQNKLQSVWDGGIFIGSRTSSGFFTGNTTWRMGADGWDGGSPYNGLTEVVYIWNRALSSYEIRTLSLFPYSFIEPVNPLLQWAAQVAAPPAGTARTSFFFFQ